MKDHILQLWGRIHLSFLRLPLSGNFTTVTEKRNWETSWAKWRILLGTLESWTIFSYNPCCPCLLSHPPSETMRSGGSVLWSNLVQSLLLYNVRVKNKIYVIGKRGSKNNISWHVVMVTSSCEFDTNLEILRKRENQLKNYLDQIGLWPCLWGITPRHTWFFGQDFFV